MSEISKSLKFLPLLIALVSLIAFLSNLSSRTNYVEAQFSRLDGLDTKINDIHKSSVKTETSVEAIQKDIEFIKNQLFK